MNIAIRPLRPEDYPAAKEIVSEAFSEEVRENPRALARYDQEAWYDARHLLVADVDGRVVSQMGTRDGRLAFGDAPVPAVLVGTVCTVEAWRGQGIGGRLMRAAVGWTSRFGPAVSYLHTSRERHGFYGRLGYRKAVISSPCLQLPLDQVNLSGEVTFRTRQARTGDVPVLGRIYEAHYGSLAGSWSRTPAFWAARVHGLAKLWSRPLVFRLRGEAPAAAYIGFRRQGECLLVEEWGCLPGAEGEARSLLGATLEAEREAGARTAQLAVAGCDPLRRVLSDLPLEDRTTHGEVLLRVQDPPLFLETVAPLLQRRARAAACRLRLRLTDTRRTITAGAGEVLEVELETGELCALLYNGRGLPGSIAAGTVGVTSGAPELLPRIFPDTGAARRHLDGY